MTVGLFKETLMGTCPGRAGSDGSDFSHERRLRRLKELVAGGRYVVDPDAVAGVLVRRAAFTAALSAELAAESRRD